VGAVIRQHLDAIAGAVQSPFVYCAQQYASSVLDHLALVGQGAAVPGVGEYLQSRLGMNVRTVTPPAVVECPETFGPRAGDPSMIVPIGLAQFPG